MALDHSALLELVEVLKTSDASELMRRMLATMMQELSSSYLQTPVAASRSDTDRRVRRPGRIALPLRRSPSRWQGGARVCLQGVPRCDFRVVRTSTTQVATRKTPAKAARMSQ
jgi:hypothetical protein